jgi:hypothetical protein
LTVVVALAAMASSPLRASQPERHTVSPTKHVIVLIGENRTFDNVFGTYVGYSTLDLFEGMTAQVLEHCRLIPSCSRIQPSSLPLMRSAATGIPASSNRSTYSATAREFR